MWTKWPWSLRWKPHCSRTFCLGPGLEPGRPRIRNESESDSTGTEIREVLGVIESTAFLPGI
jgi:hypothetical protein